MGVYIFIIALLNLAIGYYYWGFLQRRRSTESDPVDDSQEATETVVLNDVEVEDVEQVPSEWIAMLANAGIEVNSIVEAAAEVLKLEIREYRNALVASETALHSLDETDADGISAFLESLQGLNRSWVEQEQEVLASIDIRSSDFGEYEQIGETLKQVLVDQSAQIESIMETLAELNPKDGVLTPSRAQTEVARLIELAHALRDEIHLHVIAVLHNEDRLTVSTDRAGADNLTQMGNRLALTCTLDDWIKSGSHRQHSAGLAVVDLDRFSKVNARVGTKVGDRVLKVVAGMIRQVADESQSSYELFRASGQAFAILFKNVGPRNAMSVVERIRQSLEATTLQFDNEDFQVAVSCGVILVNENATVDTVINDVQSALQAAKKGGRNRTGLDEGEGSTLIDPPQYQVQGCVVQVDSDDEKSVATVSAVAESSADSSPAEKKAAAETTSEEPEVEETASEQAVESGVENEQTVPNKVVDESAVTEDDKAAESQSEAESVAEAASTSEPETVT